MTVLAASVAGMVLVLLLTALRQEAAARLARQAVMTVETLLLAEFQAAIRRLVRWR